MIHHESCSEDTELWVASVYLIESRRKMEEFGPTYFDRAFDHWEKCVRKWWKDHRHQQ